MGVHFAALSVTPLTPELRADRREDNTLPRRLQHLDRATLLWLDNKALLLELMRRIRLVVSEIVSKYVIRTENPVQVLLELSPSLDGLSINVLETQCRSHLLSTGKLLTRKKLSLDRELISTGV